ncbi:MAG TPA: undecaprenyldiphospho-muramoylpentapeptide beta-N-acetylglucosaminyltransferase [Gammaproteobacteria bacterium]
MIMAGGTGGHVFPGLAVADELRERGRGVVWLGTRRGLEARVVPQHGIEIEWISISGLRGKGIGAWAATPFRAAFAVAQALAALRRRKPSAVLGMGGFVSGPGGVAAWLARKPLLIHEQNSIAGTTNRWLARFAARVFEAFPGSFPSGVDAECIGNPIRRSIAALPPAAERIASDARRARVLVLGGSQGAAVLNRTLPAALARLPAEARPDVRHQAGARHEETRAAYRDAGVDADVTAFIDDMAAAYAWADLVVARAGALTLSELAAAGLGAVLVPYPHAIDDHQSRNAERFTAAGAAVVVAERDLDPARLAAELEALLADPGRLASMARAARGLARVDAAERLAAACLEYAEAAA